MNAFDLHKKGVPSPICYNGNNTGPVIFKSPKGFYEYLRKNIFSFYNLKTKNNEIINNIKIILHIEGNIEQIILLDDLLTIKDSTNRRYYINENDTFYWEIPTWEY